MVSHWFSQERILLNTIFEPFRGDLRLVDGLALRDGLASSVENEHLELIIIHEKGI